MQQSRLSSRLPAFQKQNLLLEFASLRHARLDGVYVSIASDDPTLWLGVIFVRKGLYAPAVLRFQMSFPPAYPALPPLVTFSTDIFHPFLTPLTTYTYTTGATVSEPVSASDDERLPPGGFSLRHGFPHWFARSRRSAASSRTPSGQEAVAAAAAAAAVGSSLLRKSETASLSSDVPEGGEEPRREVCVAEVLKYIQSTFADEAMLDTITVDTAANPGAYHAWRTHRGREMTPKPEPASSASSASADAGKSRRPSEWNWEGVWEDRVRKGIKASLSDPVLFAGGTDEIHFIPVDSEELTRLKRDIQVMSELSVASP